MDGWMDGGQDWGWMTAFKEEGWRDGWIKYLDKVRN